MAKQTKKTTKNEKKVQVIENNIIEDVQTVVNETIEKIVEKMETIQPEEEIINTVINETPGVAQEIIENEIEKIENIQKEIENKINEVINANPDVAKVMKTSNAAFTNMWNGMLVE
jgi:gamma-glutamylcysteine synthetase